MKDTLMIGAHIGGDLRKLIEEEKAVSKKTYSQIIRTALFEYFKNKNK